MTPLTRFALALAGGLLAVEAIAAGADGKPDIAAVFVLAALWVGGLLTHPRADQTGATQATGGER